MVTDGTQHLWPVDPYRTKTVNFVIRELLVGKQSVRATSVDAVVGFGCEVDRGLQIRAER